MSKCDAKKTESVRENNRSDFPATAAIMDEFRAVFGDGVKLVYAEEGGKKIGKNPPEPKRFVNADQWLKAGDLIRDELARRGLAPMLGERRNGRRRS